MVRIGLEVAIEQSHPAWGERNWGLVANQASVSDDGQFAADLWAARGPGRLTAIFSPQHGLWGEQQANMIESPHHHYPPLGLPVWSLYSETRRPTDEMLQGVTGLLIDLQDVGTRVYTFVWTAVQCLAAAAERGLPVVILDRPNPLGGQIAEGPCLEAGYESFVGLARIPLRHGLTMGELVLLANAELNLRADVQVVRMEGWRREMLFPETGRRWIPPSPNMPRWETALYYPGQVLLEGVNLSEGRGTTIPFEVVGAPWLDPFRLAEELAAWPHPGVSFRPLRFVPTFDKWRGLSCGGVALGHRDPRDVRSVMTTVSLLGACRRLAGEKFELLPPPYEYERVKPPLDILFGSSRLREALDHGEFSSDQVSPLCELDEGAWWRRVRPYLLYE